MSNWKYYNPVSIHFGPGIINDLPTFVGMHKLVLVTTPGFKKRGTVEYLKTILGNSLVAIFAEVQANPTFESVKAAFKSLQPYDYDLIVALGGGSAIDTAKIVAALESVGNVEWIDSLRKDADLFPKTFAPKDIIAIPTTAGSGSEVTMWATVWDMVRKEKHSLSHPLLYPREAVLDPALTLTLPLEETINCGLDALSHAMEAIWNKNHNPVSDRFALEAIELIYDYLPLLKNDLDNIKLRTFLLRASLIAGLAFSNTKTALAHSISYCLTSYFGLPHGLACSLPLTSLIEFNGTQCFERIKIMARALKAEKTVESMKNNLANFFKKIDIPLSLASYGINKRNAQMIIDHAITPDRADNNIVSISKTDLERIVTSLF